MLAADGPRAELMLHLRDPGDEHADVWRRLAVLAAAPAVEGVVYSPGMSVDLGEPLVARIGLHRRGASTPRRVGDLATDDGPVTVLQALPATSNELAWCRVRGSEALRERWRDAGTDLADLTAPRCAWTERGIRHADPLLPGPAAPRTGHWPDTPACGQPAQP